MNVRAIALAVAALSLGTVFATTPPPPNFPMMGLGLGQTLRLNAVANRPPPAGSPGGCVATLSFADAAGGIYQNPPPQNINLAPGQATFLDFPAQLLVTRFGGRAEVRPVVTFPAAGGISGPPGVGGTDCVFAAELFDQGSGFSSIFQTPPPNGLPGSTLSFSLMGVAFTQVVRLNVVSVERNPPPQGGPCLVTLGFVDANGNPVGNTPPPQGINPGQAVFLDLAASTLGLRQFGQRGEVRPVVTVVSAPGALACGGVVSLAETFDLTTGRTWASVEANPPPNGTPPLP